MRLQNVSLAIIAALATTSLSACGGGAQHGVLPSQPSRAASAQQVTFKIDAPKSTSSTQKSRPLYLSPATAKLAIDVQTGCPGSCVSYTGYPVTQALTPTSTGCTSTLASTQCELTIALPPNTYTATLTAEDAAGTALSTAQSIAFTVAQGTNNDTSIALSGIPASIIATTLSPTSNTMIVNALDADNNVIVGPGAPSFTVSRTAGIAVALTQPTTTSPNVFTAVPSAIGAATLQIAASYGGSGVTNACTQSGAVCSANFTLTSGAPLFVANQIGNTVTEYAPPYTGAPIATMSSGLSDPVGLTFDTAGNLFVPSFDNNTVTEYAPPYTGTPIATISNGMSNPEQVVFDSHGNLFVPNFGNGNITEYASPYTGAPIATISLGINDLGQLLFDSADNLYAPDFDNSLIKVSASPYTGTPTTLANNGIGQVAWMAFDAGGNLFVANYDGTTPSTGTVTEYASPYTGAPIATISAGINSPEQLLFDAAENLFVVNEGNNTITEYAPPYTGTPTTISNGIGGGVGAMAFDSAGNLFVSSVNPSSVTEYAAPYTNAPIATISNGLNSPYSVLPGPGLLTTIAPASS